MPWAAACSGAGITRIDIIVAWLTGSTSRRENLKLVLGLASSALAGWGAYVITLSGLSSTIRITELNSVLAGFVGVVGGVAGISVFKFVADRWFP